MEGAAGGEEGGAEGEGGSGAGGWAGAGEGVGAEGGAGEGTGAGEGAEAEGGAAPRAGRQGTSRPLDEERRVLGFRGGGVTPPPGPKARLRTWSGGGEDTLLRPPLDFRPAAPAVGAELALAVSPGGPAEACSRWARPRASESRCCRRLCDKDRVRVPRRGDRARFVPLVAACV
mmetsp:Transcript_13815/g.32772  ORF Transcript_13815/g.32772 Transcript_13815/m.32772 type:complete len:174 (+) Transcript_13815:41-562(+)